MPELIPLTIPEAEPTVAMVVLLLLQLPPPPLSYKVTGAPTHTESGPDTAGGAALTFIVVVAEQLPLE